MNPSIKFQSVVLDCSDHKNLAEFYAKLLGGKRTDIEDAFSIVSLPGESCYLSCQFDEDYAPPVWPGSQKEPAQMAHLDFSVEDMDTAVQYALSLGAKEPPVQYWQPGWGPRWVTLLDLAGHPFCLCDKEEQPQTLK